MNVDKSNLTNTRYNYFDALRGFSMIVVVFWHVMLCSIHSIDGINRFTNTFMLPLFFFISGFFAYKPFDLWNNSRIKTSLTNRFKVFFVGTSVFIIFHSIFFNNCLPRLSKFTFAVDGYWFTLLLLRFYIVYITLVMICRNIIKGAIIVRCILIFMSVLCICLHHNLMHATDLMFTSLSTAMIHIISPLFFYFFPYFISGLLAREYLPIFENILTKNTLRTTLLVIIITLWSLSYLTDSPSFQPANTTGNTLMAYPLGIPTTLLVIQFFYSLRHKFDLDTRFSNGIRFIGRRTLDIYFIHYFFLPHLIFLRSYLSPSTYECQAMLQLTVGLPIAMIVIGLSLLAGQVLRMSPVLGEWLLGARRKHVTPHKPTIKSNEAMP